MADGQMSCGYCQLGGICHQSDCTRWPNTLYGRCRGYGECDVCGLAASHRCPCGRRSSEALRQVAAECWYARTHGAANTAPLWTRTDLWRALRNDRGGQL